VAFRGATWKDRSIPLFGGSRAQEPLYGLGESDLALRPEFGRRTHLMPECRVYKQLVDDGAQHFTGIAEAMNELPWSAQVVTAV
jgi:hypothetical protein